MGVSSMEMCRVTRLRRSSLLSLPWLELALSTVRWGPGTCSRKHINIKNKLLDSEATEDILPDRFDDSLGWLSLAMFQSLWYQWEMLLLRPVATGNVCIVLDCLGHIRITREQQTGGWRVRCCRLIQSSNNQLLDDGQWCHRDQIRASLMNHTLVTYLSEETIIHLFTYCNSSSTSAYLYWSHPIVCGIRRHFHPGRALLSCWVCGGFCPRQSLVCPEITWAAQWRTEKYRNLKRQSW